jgi:hypothetical protein
MQGREEVPHTERSNTMRAIVSGIIAAAAYLIVIGTFLAMAMPTQSQVEAYIEAAHSVPISAAPAQLIDEPLAG